MTKESINPQNDNKKKVFDLQERTQRFAENVRALVSRLEKTPWNIEDGKQLIRASGSVGANYIEADESLSRKDFTHRLRICRKEAKESRYWLGLLAIQDSSLQNERGRLLQEAFELLKIFNAGVRKIEGKSFK